MIAMCREKPGKSAVRPAEVLTWRGACAFLAPAAWRLLFACTTQQQIIPLIPRLLEAGTGSMHPVGGQFVKGLQPTLLMERTGRLEDFPNTTLQPENVRVCASIPN